jgi:hypothetical protein
MTDGSGVTKFETDYTPQGSQRVITNTVDSLLKFNGTQRDTESGLDNSRRPYESSLGRVLPPKQQPQPATQPPPVQSKSSPANPQSLNPYAPALNNPVGNSVDDSSGLPTGDVFVEGQPFPPTGCVGTPSLDFFASTGVLVSSEGNCGSDMEIFAGSRFSSLPQISVTTCACNLFFVGPGVTIFDLSCTYQCRCENGDVELATMNSAVLFLECKAAKTPIPPIVCPVHVEAVRLSVTDPLGGQASFYEPTGCSMFIH